MRVLVTGVAGFIGSALAERLLRESKAEVVGVDALTDYYDPRLKRRRLQRLSPLSGFTFVKGDINSLTLDEFLEGVDVVYHLAGQPGVRSSWGTGFAEYTRSNVDATQALLEATRRANGVRRFVYASSSSVYGHARSFPCREEDTPRPVSPYGVTKLAGEHLCTLYAENYGLPTVSLRYFTVYGPGQRPDMAFTRFIDAALQGRPVPIYGDGQQVREFTFVQDIVEATIRAGEREISQGEVLNLSGGSAVTVLETLEVLERLHQRPIALDHRPSVPGDAQRTGGSADRARELLDWRPTVGLEEGLAAQYLAALGAHEAVDGRIA